MISGDETRVHYWLRFRHDCLERLLVREEIEPWLRADRIRRIRRIR
jgi:hypothetical protein